MKSNLNVKAALFLASLALCLAFCGKDKSGNPVTPPVTPANTYDTLRAGGKYLISDTVWVVWSNTALNSAAATLQFNYNRTGDNIWRTLLPLDRGTRSLKVVLPSNNVTNPLQGLSIARVYAGTDSAVVESLDVKRIILTKPVGGDTLHVGDTVTLKWRNHPSVSSLDVLLNINGNRTYLSPEGSSTPATATLKWVVGHEEVPVVFPSVTACYIDIDDYSAPGTNNDRNASPFYVNP